MVQPYDKYAAQNPAQVLHEPVLQASARIILRFCHMCYLHRYMKAAPGV